MLTAFSWPNLSHTRFFVWFNAQAVHSFIEAAEQIKDRHEFEYSLVIQA
jgi:hypothetical protein